jgi:hypothetical protein
VDGAVAEQPIGLRRALKGRGRVRSRIFASAAPLLQHSIHETNCRSRAATRARWEKWLRIVKSFLLAVWEPFTYVSHSAVGTDTGTLVVSPIYESCHSKAIAITGDDSGGQPSSCSLHASRRCGVGWQNQRRLGINRAHLRWTLLRE